MLPKRPNMHLIPATAAQHPSAKFNRLEQPANGSHLRGGPPISYDKLETREDRNYDAYEMERGGPPQKMTGRQPVPMPPPHPYRTAAAHESANGFHELAS